MPHGTEQAGEEDPSVKRLYLTTCCLGLLWSSSFPLQAAEPVLQIDQPLSAPTWALLEREVLKTSRAACRQFFDHSCSSRAAATVSTSSGRTRSVARLNPWIRIV
jgi:hypothetical protein